MRRYISYPVAPATGVIWNDNDVVLYCVPGEDCVPGVMRYGSGRSGLAGAQRPLCSKVPVLPGLAALIVVLLPALGIVVLVTTVAFASDSSDAVHVVPLPTVKVFEVPAVVPLYIARIVVPPVADLMVALPEKLEPESVIVLGVMLPMLGVRVITEPVGILTVEKPSVKAVPLTTLGIVLKVTSGLAAVLIVTLNEREIEVPLVPVQLTV